MSTNSTVRRKRSRIPRRQQKVEKTSFTQRLSGLRFFRICANLIKFFRNATFFAALPLVILFASTSTDYYVALQGYSSIEYLTFDAMPTRVEPDQAGRERGELLKTQVQALVYLFVLFLALLHFRKLLSFFVSMPILIIIPIYLATTAIQSFEPNRVISNSILTFINILAAAIFAISQQGREKRIRNLFLVVFIPFFVHQMASFGLFISLGMDIPAFIESDKRAGGFSGNPNTLSLHALIGLWAALSLLSLRNSSNFLRGFSLVGLGLFGINILMSGSGTGLLVGSVIVALMLWLNFLSAFRLTTRVAINMFLFATLFLFTAAVVLFKSPGELFQSATVAMGKDPTLTGRTDFWEIARSAIAEKFWFGWGYDNHQSILSIPEFTIPLKHFHNGFLDNAIVGGIVLIALIIVCFVIFLSRLMKELQYDYRVYPLGVAFVLLILMNLSEYTMLRPNSQPWLLFLCSLSYVVANYARIGVLPEYLWAESPRLSRSGIASMDKNIVKSSRSPWRRRRRRRRRKTGYNNRADPGV